MYNNNHTTTNLIIYSLDLSKFSETKTKTHIQMWRNVSNKALPRNLSISHSSNSILPSCSSKGVSNLPETITRAVRTNSRRDSRFMEMEEEGMEKLKFQFLRHPFSLYEMGCSQNTKFFAQQEGFRIGSLGINYGKNSISLFNRGKLAEFKCFRYPISSFEMGLCQNEELVNRRDGFRIGSSSLQWETPPISSSSIGFCQNGKLLSRKSLSFGFPKHSKCYASVAEAICSTDADEDVVVMDEVQENLGDMIKEERRDFRRRRKRFQVLRRRQLKIETEAWIETTNDYKEYFSEMCKHKRAPNLPPVKMLFLGWFEPLCNAIAAEQEKCSRNPKLGHAAFFNQLPVEMMAVITMHTLTGLLMTGDEHGRTATVQAAGKIGEAIEHEVKVHRFLEKTKTKTKTKTGKRKKEQEVEPNVVTSEQIRLRKKVEHLIKKQKIQQVRMALKSQDDPKAWGRDARIRVGGNLISFLVETAYIQPPINQMAENSPDIRPAFRHYINSAKASKKGAKKCGIIECDPLILKGLEKSAKHLVMQYKPMLVPPVKWTQYDKGAYLFLPSFVMRTHGAKQQREALKRSPQKQLTPVYEALDTLGSTKWRINRRVFRVVESIWASGGSLADMVDRDDVPVPVKPDTEDEAELKKWKWKASAAKKENRQRHSQRCDVELKLDVARKIKDEDGFFFPHNLDFRGRAYPMHPHLNHLGSDMCRGVLEFGEGRPLGKMGLRWLKIHLANLYAGGVDKLSHDGRISFTESHLDDIFDSADKPLEGMRWWLNAEDPFQCLAACINISDALRSPSPESTISHMPVHQDGSCNGLQHYAALGRDKLGAATVNLVDAEKPADVYSGIAARVLDIMRKDAQNDPETDQNALRARILINEVDRKLVKQTVMTSVYGVTYIGARDQIKKRLKERPAIADNEELFGAACYAAKITLTALDEMFEAACSIMSWLTECAKVIASENQSVRWTTPVGLPVVQPYRKLGTYIVKTPLQHMSLQRETDKVLVKRQKTAFPPNFVHSLDASHMMMTAVACKKAGLNFAGVHDSYWTHACDVDEMNRILRETFVELYQTPILENLLESFEKSFPTSIFPPLPDRGDFDLTEVLKATYFFN